MAAPPHKPRVLLILLDGCRPDEAWPDGTVGGEQLKASEQWSKAFSGTLILDRPSARHHCQVGTLRPALVAGAPRVRAMLQGRQGRCAFSLHCKTDPVPISGPSWATLLTGQRSEKHGITSNDLDSLLTIDSEGRVLVQPSECLCSPVQSGCFLGAFSQAKRRRREAALLPPTLFHFLAERNLKAELLNVGWPGVPQLCGGRELAKHLQVRQFADEAQELDKAVAEMLQLLEKGREAPAVLALYTHCVDMAGHLHGFSLDVPEYMQAIEHFDTSLGRLLDGLGQREGEDWLVAITTDHGGGAAKDMSKDMWSQFVEDCKCLHKGLSQAGCQGVHGLQELAIHSTRFVILTGSNVRPGEMTPPPESVDLVPTLLRHLAVPCGELPGKSRGLRKDT
ncbi:unnamed protein product [Effrenium voratum]|nr:unnamed protein product [Effrenium voratum]